jgi:hypothetical protein
MNNVLRGVFISAITQGMEKYIFLLNKNTAKLGDYIKILGIDNNLIEFGVGIL